MTSCFFRYNFWGVNNMYLGLRGGESYTRGVRVVLLYVVYNPVLISGHTTVKSTVDRLTSFRAQLSRANETFAVSRNNDFSRTGETYEFIYFLKKRVFAHCVYFTVAYAQNFTYFTQILRQKMTSICRQRFLPYIMIFCFFTTSILSNLPKPWGIFLPTSPTLHTIDYCHLPVYFWSTDHADRIY